MALDSVEFRNCCGIEIVYGFGSTFTAGAGMNTTPEQADKGLEQIVSDPYKKHKALMVTINEDQLENIWPILVKHGFKRISSFYHSRHEQNVYVYMKTPAPRKI